MAEFEIGVHIELKIRPQKEASTLISSRSSDNKSNIRPTKEATACSLKRGSSPIINREKMHGKKIIVMIILTKKVEK